MSLVLLVKSNLKFVGITPPVSVIRSARFRVFWVCPSSRYGRRDSSQVVGIPHSLAMLVSSWAMNQGFYFLLLQLFLQFLLQTFYNLYTTPWKSPWIIERLSPIKNSVSLSHRPPTARCPSVWVSHILRFRLKPHPRLRSGLRRRLRVAPRLSDTPPAP